MAAALLLYGEIIHEVDVLGDGVSLPPALTAAILVLMLVGLLMFCDLYDAARMWLKRRFGS